MSCLLDKRALSRNRIDAVQDAFGERTLEKIRLTNRGRCVFPSLLTRERPMSENIINAALRRLGRDGSEQTGHGFRSMASTLSNEQGVPATKSVT